MTWEVAGTAHADQYAEFADGHPNRVKAVLIRDVDGGRRAQRVRKRLANLGARSMLFETAAQAQARCRDWGLLNS